MLNQKNKDYLMRGAHSPSTFIEPIEEPLITFIEKSPDTIGCHDNSTLSGASNS